MRILLKLGGIASLGLAILVCTPVAVMARVALAPGHEETVIASVTVLGRTLSGSAMWAFGALLALVGVFFGFIGIYSLRALAKVGTE